VPGHGLNEEGGSIVTAVKPSGKKGRYDIEIGGVRAATLHEDIVVKHRLVKGRRVTEEELRAALDDDIKEEAYRKAVRWLAAKPRTEAEMRLYLRRKGCESGQLDEIVGRLKAQGAIDDEKFSESWTEERLHLHRKGTRLIKQELLGKGVDRRIVQEALGNVDPDAERKSAAALARKRWPILAASGDRKAAVRKLYAYLARRGYSHSAIRTAIREAQLDADIAEEFGGGD